MASSFPVAADVNHWQNELIRASDTLLSVTEKCIKLQEESNSIGSDDVEVLILHHKLYLHFLFVHTCVTFSYYCFFNLYTKADSFRNLAEVSPESSTIERACAAYVHASSMARSSLSPANSMCCVDYIFLHS
jgi:hypothetical protein